MTSKTSVRIDFKVLDDLVAKLTEDNYAKVGIIDEAKKQRKEGPIDNVELGIVHELGSHSRGIPARSFLRMPMEEKRNEIAGFMSSNRIKKKIAAGDVKGALADIGVYAESWIQAAFASRGFGKWRPISPFTAARKGSTAILIETGQLRRAVSSEVVEK